ncbi:MAG: hypothetical protein U0K91_04095 [Acutalibacteraceae bacterium]|nr:hypothetical protein [Acutalibacteraceae bacterium]
MDEFKNMNGNSAEDNKVKIDFSNIESTESGFASDDRFGITEETAEAPVETVPQYVEQFPVTQMPVQPQIPAEPEKDNVKAVETEAAKAKKDKRNKNLDTFVRVFVISLLSVITLWTVMYTVDHSLAAQGIAPLFSVSSTEYTVSYLEIDEPAAFSYKCLGYKVQFLTNENYQLTQDCVWAWEEGPNDILLQRGQLFPVGTEQ